MAEYYRVPPQKDRNWELELYDESRDTWFKLTPDDLDRYADLSGSSSGSGDGGFFVDEANKMTWPDFLAGGGHMVDNNPFQLKMDAEPTSTSVIMPRLLRPDDGLNWGNTYRQIININLGAFTHSHTKEHYYPIVQECDIAHVFVPKPNCTNFTDAAFPGESRHVPYWLFMNAAFLDSTCQFLWTHLQGIDRDIMRTKIIPFVYGPAHNAVLADYNSIPDDARMNIYHTIMFLGGPLRWHPDDDVRRMLEAKFAERRVGPHTLRAALVHFVKRCLDDVTETIPRTRIELGRKLDEVLCLNLFLKNHKRNYLIYSQKIGLQTTRLPQSRRPKRPLRPMAPEPSTRLAYCQGCWCV